MGDLRGGPERRLGARRIEQVTLEVEHLRALDERAVEIQGAQLDAGAEVGVHRALRVRRHQDEAARGRGTHARRRHAIGDTRGGDVMAEHPAQLVVADQADITRAAAQRGEPRHGVGDRSAGHLHPGPHLGIEPVGFEGVDEARRPLDEAAPGEEGLVRVGDHVDDRVADADDVVGCAGHVREAALGKTGSRSIRTSRAGARLPSRRPSNFAEPDAAPPRHGQPSFSRRVRARAAAHAPRQHPGDARRLSGPPSRRLLDDRPPPTGEPSLAPLAARGPRELRGAGAHLVAVPGGGDRDPEPVFWTACWRDSRRSTTLRSPRPGACL